MTRLLKWLCILIVIGVVCYGALAAFWGVPSVAKTDLATDAETIAKGKYLVEAGDCASCHTNGNGAAFAGGLPLATPFGQIYSTNLTPSDSGIKGMTTAEFYQLLAYGADDMWHPLYPAMPYTSFHNVTRADSDAMLAWLMTLPPIDQKPPANTLGFPYNIRIAMFGWNLLFADRAAFKPTAGKSDLWNRGAYLAEGLAHCGECHTPRGVLGEMQASKALQGGSLGEFIAPDITTKTLVAQGWTQRDLIDLFATGTSPKGSAFSEMAQAIHMSLSRLTDDDRQALAAYLLDANDPAPSAPAAATAQPASDLFKTESPGLALYSANCSLCHGTTGLGETGAVPSLVNNATLAQADGNNMIRVIANGLKAQDPVPGTGNPALGPMPAFRDRLSAAEMTELANFLRKAFAPQMPEMTETQIGTALAASAP